MKAWYTALSMVYCFKPREHLSFMSSRVQWKDTITFPRMSWMLEKWVAPYPYTVFGSRNYGDPCNLNARSWHEKFKNMKNILRWLLTHFTHAYKTYFSVYGPMLQLWYYINCISQTWIYLPRVSTLLFIKQMKSTLFWQWYESARHINLLFLNLI
jgi:hypothetical protein